MDKLNRWLEQLSGSGGKPHSCKSQGLYIFDRQRICKALIFQRGNIMSVFRVQKNQNYTVLSNYHFKEKSMTLKAKGLLSLMLSLPDDWDYSITGLVTLSRDGESAVRTALKELESFKYLKRAPIRECGKIVDWEYSIFEKPYNDFPEVENLKLDNQPQLNTKESSTEDFISKDIKYRNTKSQNSFLGSIEKKKGKNLYAACLDIINSKTNDQELQTKLVIFLDSLLERNKLRGRNQFNGSLNKLFKLGENNTDKLNAILDYTIEHGYLTFYDITKRSNSSVAKSIEHSGVDHVPTMTEEDYKQLQEDVERRRKNGQRTSF